jgi:L-threonylcarbamoyladenylate synthase
MCVALLNAFGSGVAAPSANRHHHLSPTSADHVYQDFGDSLPLILDGGPCKVGLESTVLSLAYDTPKILRQGAISARRIEEALARPVELVQTEKPKYTQDIQIRVLPRTSWTTWLERYETVTIMSIRPIDAFSANWVQMPPDPKAYQQKLFGMLRQLQTSAHELVLVEPVPDEPA